MWIGVNLRQEETLSEINLDYLLRMYNLYKDKPNFFLKNALTFAPKTKRQGVSSNVSTVAKANHTVFTAIYITFDGVLKKIIKS